MWAHSTLNVGTFDHVGRFNPASGQIRLSVWAASTYVWAGSTRTLAAATAAAAAAATTTIIFAAVVVVTVVIIILHANALQLISHYFSAPLCQVRWEVGY